MYEYDTLEKIRFSGMAECFQDAFSDYQLEVKWDENYLTRRFEGSGIDFARSYGAFLEGKLVGFLLNASGIYNDEKVLFDAATGVVPEHRGKGIYSNLLKCCRHDFKKGGIHSYFLEVLKSNDPAVAIYEKKELVRVRELICFKGKQLTKQQEVSISCAAISELGLGQFLSLVQYPTSFENRFEAVCAYKEKYNVIYTGTAEDVNTFVVYDKCSCQVRMIGRKPEKMRELEQLFVYLSDNYTEISVYNIDSRDIPLLKSLTELGFEKYCEQYEMMMKV